MNTPQPCATYCPEDDKLRLYIGRVPRDEYEALRKEGWTPTPKQDCDFVAIWRPDRHDTALDYAGVIEDEDAGPNERAADRAERFSEYRNKRTAEAIHHADHYDAGPGAHGFQSIARAERAARRHDRQAARAVDAWDRAAYWTARTAGVIASALYKSGPDVRMGRIKTIETEIRRLEAYNAPPSSKTARWISHLKNRLAYENQMLEAQGGRAAYVEMIPGGFLGSRQIHRVHKSAATGRVTSVDVLTPQVTGWVYKTRNIPGTEYSYTRVETERLPADAYRPPTADELTGFKRTVAALKASKPANPHNKPPLINPTAEDAERLQALINAHHQADIDGRNPHSARQVEPAAVLYTTQAAYSKNSKGTYCAAGTLPVFTGGHMPRSQFTGWIDKMTQTHGAPVCYIRRMRAGDQAGRVIVLTDKPQKSLPAALFTQAATV